MSPEPWTMTTAERIRQLRERLGLSQAAVAEGLFHPSYLHFVEIGARQPTGQQLSQLAGRLGCSSLYLSYGVTPEQADTLAVDLRAAADALYRGRHEAGVRLYERVLSAPIVAALPGVRLDAMLGLARGLEIGGNDRAAINVLESITAETVPGERYWSDSWSALTRCRRRVGDLDGAITGGERALAELAEIRGPGRWGAPGIMVAAALLPAYAERGDRLRSERLSVQVLERLGGGRDPEFRAAVLWHVAEAAQVRGDMKSAVRRADEAYALADQPPLPPPLTFAIQYADLLLRTGRPEAALRALDVLAGDELSDEMPTSDVSATRLILRARANLALGDPARAIGDLLWVHLPSTAAVSIVPRARAFGELGNAYLALHRPEYAVAAFGQSTHLLRLGGRAKEAEEARSTMEVAENQLVAQKAQGVQSDAPAHFAYVPPTPEAQAPSVNRRI